MCGIAGAIRSRPGGGVSPELLRRMADAMRHRGPDGSGLWLSKDSRAGLSHRRLAIVDLSEAGAQPMGNADGKIQVSFNGEIYNFKELRAGLEAKGYRFRSQTDTEVLVYLYERMGERMMDLLDGDFAFGIWDDRLKRLLLARDRAGVHPLYYTETQGLFLFASELKALLQCPDLERTLDEESLYHYLTYLVVPPPRTLFKGVFKLPAAGMLTLDLAGDRPEVVTHRYWEPLPGRMEIHADDLDAQFEELFDRSVRKRLMSDVPVGVLFSGGVDSTLNAASFQRLIRPERVKTFHVSMAGTSGDSDEYAWAEEMASRLGAEHHAIRITEDDLLRTAERLAEQQDEPISDPVCVPLYFVTKLARECGVKVLHAGEGADEVFCGYDNYRSFIRYYRALWKPLSKIPAALIWLGFRFLRASRDPRARKIADVLRRSALNQGLFMSGAVAYYEDEKASVLSRDFRQRHAGRDSFDVVAPLYRRIEEQVPDATFLQKITFIELQLRLPELLLMRADKMAMANSVEPRVPFLDRDLVDFALSVPDSFKLRDGVSKEPVKRLAARHVDRDAVYRPKTGFGVPIREWFRTGLGSHMRELLEEDRQEIEAYFDCALLGRTLKEGPATVNQAFHLWVVYNLLQWRRAFLAQRVEPWR